MVCKLIEQKSWGRESRSPEDDGQCNANLAASGTTLSAAQVALVLSEFLLVACGMPHGGAGLAEAAAHFERQ